MNHHQQHDPDDDMRIGQSGGDWDRGLVEELLTSGGIDPAHGVRPDTKTVWARRVAAPAPPRPRSGS